MSDFHSLQDFLEPVQMQRKLIRKEYADGQIGKHIEIYEEEFPDLYEKDIIIIGCGEVRGTDNAHSGKAAPDAIREQFYQLFIGIKMSGSLMREILKAGQVCRILTLH